MTVLIGLHFPLYEHHLEFTRTELHLHVEELDNSFGRVHCKYPISSDFTNTQRSTNRYGATVLSLLKNIFQYNEHINPSRNLLLTLFQHEAIIYLPSFSSFNQP